LPVSLTNLEPIVLIKVLVSSHQGPSVSKASALKIKFADFNILYFSCFFRQAISAAAPASTDVCERYELASVSTQVTSQMRRWPFDQGVSVAPSGLLPSSRERFVGSSAICNSLQKFLNIKFNENQWTLASLPISNGGLGIRKIQDISLPAFLGSIHGVHDLVFQILPKTDKKVSVHFAEEAIGLWIELNGKTFPTETFLQKGWDIINTTRIIANEINLCHKIGSARFLAAQRKESNAWLHAFPSRNIGTFMDNKILQICVANRFGVEIFEKHTCHCGFTVSNDGRHGLKLSSEP
jgi:hypothetical protein